MRWLSVILAATAIALSGCASQAASRGTPDATAAPPVATREARTEAPASPRPDISPSVGPSASAAVTDLPQAGTDVGNVVFPGTYRTQFTPPLVLTVGSEVELSCVPGYRCRGDVDVNLPGWLNLGFGNNPGYEVHFFRLASVFDPAHPKKLIKPPADLARWVASVPGTSVVGQATSVQVGGIEATQLDVQSGDKDVTFAPIQGVKDGRIGFSRHQAHRIIVLRVKGEAVMIMVGVVLEDDAAGVTPEELHAATDFLQPLIDSVVWQ